MWRWQRVLCCGAAPARSQWQVPAPDAGGFQLVPWMPEGGMGYPGQLEGTSDICGFF